MIRLAMAGASGRMGKTILGLALKDRTFKIVGALEHSKCPDMGRDLGEVLGSRSLGIAISSDTASVLSKADVLIDFTHASAVKETLKRIVKHKTAYVLGTTGLDKSLIQQVQQASKKIAIVQSPNMSIGVNLLFALSRMAGLVLDESYDAEIAEVHHRGKKDSPSGTAMNLLDIVAEARKRNPAKDAVYGRKGDIGVRPKGKIGILALRGGDVVGDHTLSFLGDGERLELTHKASSREAFARGALKAAQFISKKKKGLYDMQQVLGIQ